MQSPSPPTTASPSLLRSRHGNALLSSTDHFALRFRTSSPSSTRSSTLSASKDWCHKFDLGTSIGEEGLTRVRTGLFSLPTASSELMDSECPLERSPAPKFRLLSATEATRCASFRRPSSRLSTKSLQYRPRLVLALHILSVVACGIFCGLGSAFPQSPRAFLAARQRPLARALPCLLTGVILPYRRQSSGFLCRAHRRRQPWFIELAAGRR